MKSKILKQTSNPLLEREEFILEIENSIHPTKEEITKELGKDPELTYIKKINNSFGKSLFNVEIYVYNNKEAKEKYTVIPKKIRIKLEQEKKVLEEELKKKKQQEKEAKEKQEQEEKEKNNQEENNIKQGEEKQDGN